MTAADTTWMRDAACGRPPHRGLPWLGDVHTLPPVLVDLMGQVCAACPVLAACAGYAAATEVTGGFWAGADRDLVASVVQLDLEDLLEAGDLGGAA